MKFLFLFILTISLSAVGNSQNKIEFSLFATYKKHADYTSKYNNVSYTNNLKLYGTDWGFNVLYKKQVYKKWYAKIGIGYLDFAVDKITNYRSDLGITSNGRSINYPDLTTLLFSTTKYHYNNASFNLGIERQFQINQKLIFLTGIDYSYCYTFSQIYYINYSDYVYKTQNGKPFGNFINYRLGFLKQGKRISIGSNLIIPIFESWKQDIVFYEDPNKSLNTWFNGIGLSINAVYSFH